MCRKNQIILCGFIFHLVAAVFSIGYHHCDELFQVFEFAGYKLGLNSATDLPWEFGAQMRSGLQPLFVYLISKICYTINTNNPFTIALIIRLIQSLFSFFVTIEFLKLFENYFNDNKFKNFYWFFGLLFWLVPYFHARFSSENLSTSIFILALISIFKLTQNNEHKLLWLLAGLLFGLSFLIRFQTAFFILGFFTWYLFAYRKAYSNLILLLFGAFIALGIGILADYWLYDKIVFSWWNYLSQNLFQNKANLFGTSPWYFYLTEIVVQLIPPFSLVFLYSMFLFWKNYSKHLIAFITIPFLFIHFFIPHKELRFLFPLLSFLPLFMTTTIQYLSTQNNFISKLILSKWFVNLFFSVNIVLLLFFSLKPADDNTPILKEINQFVNESNSVLLYGDSNPYNKQMALNFFKNKNLELIPCSEQNENSLRTYYLYSDKFVSGNFLIQNKHVFIKLYSNYPPWISKFNFNGWLNRANCFSIYKCYQKK